MSRTVWLSILVFWLFSAVVQAVTPISQYFDLVAGEGEAGYRDGTFTAAMFNGARSAAFSADKTKIFVADTVNNRIRVVDLDNKNAVSTLAGTGEKGGTDGSFTASTFNQPSLMLSVSETQLVVYDVGGKRFRELDLSKNLVSTLLNEDSKETQGTFGVASMVFDSQSHSIYFSEPDTLTLKKLDIVTRQVSTVFYNDPRVPHPYALCYFKGHLCVADQYLPTVYQVDPAVRVPVPTVTPLPTVVNTPSASDSVGMTQIALGEKIVAMTESDNILYAFQAADIPWVRLTAGPGMPVGEIKFMTLWAPFLEPKSKGLQNLFNFSTRAAPGFLPFPDEPRKFLWISPDLNQIFAIRDYAFYENKDSAVAQTLGSNPNGLSDFSYPAAKPPHTFRILMLGDSHVFYESEEELNRWSWGFHRMETTPKKLEAELNLEASLDNVPTHFQVLTYARYRWAGSLPLWPYFFGVDPAKKFDVDAVILLMPNEVILDPWFTKPYLKEGIPNMNIDDAEYMLKSMEEKLSGQPVAKDFYERCLAKTWVAKDKWNYPDIRTFSYEPKVWTDLVDIVGLPLGLYRDKLKELEIQEGHKVSFSIFFVPIGSIGAPAPTKVYQDLYTEICQKRGIDFEDLTEPWTALKISGYPTGEFWGYHHFDYNGHTLLSYLIAHTLIRRHLIPFELEKNSLTAPAPVKGL